MESFSSLIDDIALTYTTDTIFILGKGPSADAVRPEILSSSLVIGLNDAERIAPVDITLFHAEWVLKGLAESGYRSRLYVTSVPFSPPRGQLLRVPHHALTQESADLVMQRLLTDEIAVEDILFLSALKLARMVAKQRGRTQTVYMIGFDFTPNTGQSRQIGTDYAPHPTDERETRILLQENYFLNALYFLQNSEVTVKHVGTRAFSSLSPDELNAAILGPAARLKRAEHRVKVVAELTTNHFGDRKRLERMVRAATAAGADYIKLQKRDVATFYSKEQLASSYRSPFGPTFGDYRYGLELSHDDFVFVDELCRQLGVSWFAVTAQPPLPRNQSGEVRPSA